MSEINIIGLQGYETFPIDSNTIGVRPKWISVKDRLPENSNDVLVICDNLRMAVSCYFTLNGKDYHWENRDDQNLLGNVIYWMDLPAVPVMKIES